MKHRKLDGINEKNISTLTAFKKRSQEDSADS